MILSNTSSQAPSKVEINTIWGVGDLHGDVICARHWIELTQAINGNISDITTSDSWTWADDSVQIVFVGDYVDKGPTGKQVVELVMALETRFPTRVTALLGNHELELLLDRDQKGPRNYYYELTWSGVHPLEYLNWLEPSEITEDTHIALSHIHETLLHEVYGKNKFRSMSLSSDGPNSIVNSMQPASIRPLVSRELKRLQQTYVAGISDKTEIGKWLQKRPVTHAVADSIFLHGGINPRLTDRLLPDLKAFEYLNEQFLSHSSEELLPNFIRTTYGRAVYDLVTYRGNHKSCPEVRGVAHDLGVERIILGHTPSDNVKVSCRNTLLAIDSALGRWIRKMGNFFCVGVEDERSSNGQFVCEKVDDVCSGQVMKLVGGVRVGGEEEKWKVQIVSRDGKIINV